LKAASLGGFLPFCAFICRASFNCVSLRLRIYFQPTAAFKQSKNWRQIKDLQDLIKTSVEIDSYFNDLGH
jgi:hypothetical protein